MAIFGLFRPFCPFWAILAPFSEGFYINPSRRGPRNPFFGVLAGDPGKPRFSGFFGLFPQIWGNLGFSDPRRGLGLPGSPGRAPETPPGNRGAPARGVDVKPLAGTRVRGPPGPLPGLRDPFLGSWGPPGAPGPLQGPGDPSRGLRRQGFYINPSRRGPAVPGTPSRGSGSFPFSGEGGWGMSPHPGTRVEGPTGVDGAESAGG